jgi:hypothetical protein
MVAKSAVLPADLAAARTRIDKWRAGAQTRRPIPKDLWRMAVDLVPTHGVYRVSRALRLRYDRVKAATNAHYSKRRIPSTPAFVQVTAPALAMPSLDGELTVEVTDRHGNHMCIRSSATMDAVRLVSAFCGGAT